VGKFVEFYGPGVSQLSIADRATISNMCPEYGATVGFFPVDDMSMKYLKQTGEEYIVGLSLMYFNKGELYFSIQWIMLMPVSIFTCLCFA